MDKTETLPNVSRFAIINLEMPATRLPNSILEIAVLIFEDDGTHFSLVETYNTLIKPESEMPSEILEEMDLTPEELQVAPKFSEIIEDLDLLTKDCTLIGPRIEEDIKILQSEFKKLNLDYLREREDIEDLAQEQLPDLNSHDFKSLCEHFALGPALQHRIIDEAFACAEIFEKISFKSRSLQQKKTPLLSQMHHIHPGLDLSFLSQLSSHPGLVHFNSEGKTIYIEHFENMAQELPRFLLRFEERFQENIDNLRIQNFRDSLMAMRKKEERIRKIHPFLNMKERKTSWGVFLKENPFSLRAFPLFKGKGDILFISPNREDALHWIRLQLSDIEKEEFAYIDQEDQKLINRLKKEREKQIRAKVKHFAQYPHPHFVVMGPGRDDDELSCHFFSNGKLSGHAFLSGQLVFSLDCAPSSLKPLRENDLIKHYFLREFQNWKTHSRTSHSIKVLKSLKSIQKKNEQSNGNTIEPSPNEHRPHYKKKSKNNNKNNNNKKKKKTYYFRKKKRPQKGNRENKVSSNS